jgi:hypothetical protein
MTVISRQTGTWAIHFAADQQHQAQRDDAERAHQRRASAPARLATRVAKSATPVCPFNSV